MKPRPYLLRELGFSLMELIVVMVVLGIVASIGSTVLREGFVGYLRGKEISGADWQGRIAFERMARDLRAIASPTDILAAGCSSSTFTFSDVSETQFSYTLAAGSLNRSGQSLADSVTGLRFTCLLSDGQATTAVASLVYFVNVSMIVATANTSSVYRTTIKPTAF